MKFAYGFHILCLSVCRCVTTPSLSISDQELRKSKLSQGKREDSALQSNSDSMEKQSTHRSSLVAITPCSTEGDFTDVDTG